MKRINNIFYLLAACLFLFSACSEEDSLEKAGGGSPTAITDVTTESGPGEVILKWKIPTEDANFYYVDIEYTNSNGVLTKKQVSKFAADENAYVSDTIGGFTNTEDYKFTLTARNLSGAGSAAVEIVGTPNKSILDLVLPTITLSPDFGGAVVTWENTTGKKASVSITYPSPTNPGKTDKKTFDATKSGTGNIAGLSATGEITFVATVEDAFYNESGERSFAIAPYAEVELDKSQMSIPGHVSGTSGTIGYSSQASNESPAPRGQATCIIDGIFDTSNTNSFWSSSWNPQMAYPHWIVVDLGAEYTVSRVEMMGRMRSANTPDDRAQIGQQFLTCTTAGASDPTNSEVWAWEDQGTYDFNPKTLDHQSFRLSNNPKTRYLKIYFPLDKKGSGSDAMVGEIWVYGAGE